MPAVGQFTSRGKSPPQLAFLGLLPVDSDTLRFEAREHSQSEILFAQRFSSELVPLLNQGKFPFPQAVSPFQAQEFLAVCPGATDSGSP